MLYITGYTGLNFDFAKIISQQCIVYSKTIYKFASSIFTNID